MKEDNDSLERSLEPTPRRKEEARKEGQVPRSRELNTMLLVLGGGGLLIVTGTHIFATFIVMMQKTFNLQRINLLDFATILQYFTSTIWAVLVSLLPFFVSLLLITLLSPVFMGGWNLSFKTLAFKGERISLFKGFKRMFSLRSLTELLKSVAKFILILLIGILMMWLQSRQMMALDAIPIYPAIFKAINLLGTVLIGLSLALLIVAAIDVPFQLWDHQRKLKMTHREMKDESKETEGDPEIKRKVRALQDALARQRMMMDIPKADVIVTNPTHFAVALKYDDKKSNAPIVVAKGLGLIAEHIRKLAMENRVTIFRAPPLARALYFSTEVGQEIPMGLYMAVAKILAFIFQQKQFVAGRGPKPQPVDELPIPEELQHA